MHLFLVQSLIVKNANVGVLWAPASGVQTKSTLRGRDETRRAKNRGPKSWPEGDIDILPTS